MNAPDMPRTLDLEDFEVGQTFTAGPVTVSAEAMKAFARDYDPQPFHIDEDAAKGTFFGSLAGSGWHTAALTMRMLVDSGLKPASGLIGASGELAWPRPVRPGDTLRITVDVLEVRASQSRPGQGFVKARITTLNQKDEPVQIFICNLLVFSRNYKLSTAAARAQA